MPAQRSGSSAVGRLLNPSDSLDAGGLNTFADLHPLRERRRTSLESVRAQTVVLRLPGLRLQRGCGGLLTPTPRGGTRWGVLATLALQEGELLSGGKVGRVRVSVHHGNSRVSWGFLAVSVLIDIVRQPSITMPLIEALDLQFSYANYFKKTNV